MGRHLGLLAALLLAPAFGLAQSVKTPATSLARSVAFSDFSSPALKPLLWRLPPGLPERLRAAALAGEDLSRFAAPVSRALEAARPEGIALLDAQAREVARILPPAYKDIPDRSERAERFEAAILGARALEIYDPAYAARIETTARALRANAARKRTYQKALKLAETLLPVPGTEAELGAALDEVSARYGLAGLAVVGISGGKVDASVHLGKANVARGAPVTGDTAFRMASVSKSVAAVALLSLFDQGKFGLDDDVSGALGYTLRNPKHPDSPITYRHLLTHTSGIRDRKSYFQFLDKTFSGGPVPALRSLLAPDGADFGDGAHFGDAAPGRKFEYSNLGYGIIGTLVERLSGGSFEDFAQKAVLRPLGMEASFTASGLPRPERLATVYRAEGDGTLKPSADDFGGAVPPSRVPAGYRPGENGLIYAPMGGLRVSALDLSKFLRMLMNGGVFEGARVLAESTVAQMTAPAGRWGLGVHSTEGLVNGETWTGHTGEAYGLQSEMYFRQGGSEGVVFVTNGIGADIDSRGWSFKSLEREVFRLVTGFLRR